MKLRALSLALVAPLLLAAVPAGFTPIFDGKSLAGWHISQTNHHGNSKGWSVKDGVLNGTTVLANDGDLHGGAMSMTMRVPPAGPA